MAKVHEGLPNRIDSRMEITKQISSRKQWLAFVKCIAQDNVDDLQSASKHLNWTDFLQSTDASAAWSECDSSFTHAFKVGDSKHPMPTNPFFVAIFYNAQRCLKFMLESGVDFSTINDNGFTAYHVLMSAIRFLADESGENASCVTDECKSLINLFHQTLFSVEQQQRMLQVTCKLGMRPLSWGVFLGLANYVEYVMAYCVPTSVVQSDAVGLNERITIDVSDMTGENPAFFTSPISVLLDVYGENSLAEIKAVGIFRTGFFWKQWVEALYNRNRLLFVMLFINIFALSLLSVTFSGANLNDYLRSRCANELHAPPYGLLAVLVNWLLSGLFGLFCIIYGLMRKERYRLSVGYPCTPRKGLADIVAWYLPIAFSTPTSCFLLWLYLDTDRSCVTFGVQIYQVSGCCIMLLLVAANSLLISYLRHIRCLITIMSSLYRSIVAFGLFVLMYMMLVGVFARIFQSSFAFSKALNSTSTRPDDIYEFLKAYYQTFLVSLNIVDPGVFYAAGDRIDLVITHVFYILFVPVLFINFVIGILSSIASHVQEHSVENRYMLMLVVAEFAETCFFIRHKLTLWCQPRQEILICLCRPVSKHSRLITKCNDSFESALEPDTNSGIVISNLSDEEFQSQTTAC